MNISIFVTAGFALATLLAVVAPPTDAQEWKTDPAPGAPWTLERVVEEALARNAEVREARSMSTAARARADAARAFAWPSAGLRASYARSTDPVFAFGSKLREGSFAESDLAIDALNFPAAVGDWSLGVGATWQVASPSLWAGASVGAATSEASSLSAKRTQQVVAYRARVLFLHAVSAEAHEQAALFDEAAKRESRRVIGLRESEGLGTEADRLRAEAELLAASAKVRSAAQTVSDARSRLAVFLARDPADIGELVLEAADTSRPDSTIRADPADRADVQTLAALADASEARLRQARFSRLPSLELFAGWDRYGTGSIVGDEGRWTAGIRASVPLFTGFGTESEIRSARAELEAAGARLEQARLNAYAEVREASGAVESSAEALESARAASRAAEEALILVRHRFEEGLTTTVDLFDAQARAAGHRAALVDAKAEHRLAIARLELAAPVNVFPSRSP